MNPNDDMDALKSKDNILDRIERLEAKVSNLFTGDTKAVTLDEISEDLGQLRMGDFIATSGDGDPGDPNFTGTFMSANGFLINGATYHIGGMKDGQLMWAGNSDTGKFVFCWGNAYIDNEGMTGSDLLKWMIRQIATNDIYTRTGKLGMALKEGGGTIPVWQLSYEDDAGAELATNGDFETGDFTGWTKTTETNGSWVIDDDVYNVIDGTYSLSFSPSDVNQSGVLTGDRIAGIAGKNINFSGKINPIVLTGTVLAKIEIKWYDHASAGSLLQTDILGQVTAPFAGDFVYNSTISAPVGALSCEIVITHQKSGITGSIHYDSISVTEVAINQKLWIEDDGVECSNGLYPTEVNLWGNDVTTQNSAGAGVTTYKVVDTAQYFNYVAGIANADANDGDKYIWNGWTAKAGTYTLTYLGRRGTSLGKFDVYIDDVLVSGASTDSYGSLSNNLTLTVASLDIAYGGVHKLEIRVNGKHASSSDYTLLVTKLNLRRTGD